MQVVGGIEMHDFLITAALKRVVVVQKEDARNS